MTHNFKAQSPNSVRYLCHRPRAHVIVKPRRGIGLCDLLWVWEPVAEPEMTGRMRGRAAPQGRRKKSAPNRWANYLRG